MITLLRFRRCVSLRIRRPAPLLSTLALTLPFAIYVRDDYCSAHVVRGSSMEPSLRDGDVVLVCRADLFPGFRRSWLETLWRRCAEAVGLAQEEEGEREMTPREEEERRRDEIDLKKARRIARRDDVGISVGSGDGNELHDRGVFSAVATRPVTILPGDVILFRSPRYTFAPVRYDVKRVLGLGGQRVRTTSDLRSVEYVPSWGLWVEGDNREEGKSYDSGSYGPLNSKLMVGKAVRVLWPPSRWGEVTRKRPRYGRTWWME
uniref:Mitochondrial inner membrane protease subunit n=1 Tax=Odontella aurita TaxID=265563 RepID=A0A7S4MNR6_9STRA